MTRQEIREKIRAENPTATERNIADATLNEWMKSANMEVCCRAKCIVTNTSATFTSVANTQYYDLETQITNFYQVDDMPGGGVYYNNQPLDMATPGEMNYIAKSWKSRSAGTPKKWWRRGKYLWFDRKPDSAVTVAVDAFLFPEDFDSDSEEPYNGLSHLTPFHDAIVKYVQFKIKQKDEKEGPAAYKEYIDYVAWMAKEVKGSRQSAIFMRNAANA